MLRLTAMYRLLRALLFALPPEDAHEAGMAALQALSAVPPLCEAVGLCLSPPLSLARERMGLRFASPVGLAAGFDKDARAPHALAALGFGFLELGTVTAQAQGPNPPPNLFRLPDDRALVNRLGFPNAGAEVVARRFLALVGRRPIGVPVGFSIGKSRGVPASQISAVIDDYLASLRAVLPAADFVVVNVSSPNTVGLRALQGADLAARLLAAIMQESARDGGAAVPVLLQLSPDLADDDLDALLRVVREAGLAGVIATNTTVGRSSLASRPEHVRAVGVGGLSGAPLLPRTLGIVPRIRASLGPEATVVAAGGVSSAADVRRCLEAGADLVQLYTSFVYEGPLHPSRLARALAPGA